MLRNYVTVAIRNLLRRRLYAAINVLGLAVGIACCFLVLLYVADDLLYDQHHEKGHRIFRVVRATEGAGGMHEWSTSGALGPALLSDFPEIEESTRIFTDWASSIRYEDNQQGGLFAFADPSIFDMFTLPFVAGDPKTALKAPGGLVLTEQMAVRLFGSANPIGQAVSIDCDWIKADFTVTGVLRDFPRQTSFFFDVLFSPNSVSDRGYLQRMRKAWASDSGYRIAFRTYVQLPEGYAPASLEQKLADFIVRHMGQEEANRTVYRLQQLDRLHLFGKSEFGFSEGAGGVAPPADISQLALLVLLANFVLLVASINFINLTTARSAERAREIGIRKAVGAARGNLIRQFIGESVVLASGGVLLAGILVQVALPRFNTIAQRNLSLPVDPVVVVVTVGAFLLLIGVLAGAYPALVLSRLSPVKSLKGSDQAPGRSTIRSGLVVFQFALSIFLMASTAVVYRQLEFMTNKDFGFNIDHVIDIPIFGSRSALRKDPEQVKAAFGAHSGVVALSAIAGWPGGLPGDKVFTVRPDPETTEELEAYFIGGDKDLLDVYRIELVAGRRRTGEIPNEVLLNETAVRQLGWTDPIGRMWTWRNPIHDKEPRVGTVVGIVKDFHFQTMHHRVKPLFIGPPDQLFTLLVRVQPKNLEDTIAFLKSKWDQLVPEKTFAYGFEAAHFDRIFYKKEKVISAIVLYASGLSVIIACFGLLGLAVCVTERRTKEIGIRKVLGASAARIVGLLAKDFVRLVIIANLISWPVAYWLINKWLSDYAYRVEIGWGPVLLSGGTAVLIALLTVGSQSLRAAAKNPADILRTE